MRRSVSEKLYVKAAIAASFAVLSACATTQTAQTTEKPERPSSRPSAPVYQLADILGAEPSAVDAMLGAPALTRREGEGEYRRYPLRECVLIVLLYPDDSGRERAAHVDAAAHISGEAKPDLETCLAAG